MSALSAFLLFAVGNSLYAASVLLGVLSYLSQVMMFHALRTEFSGAEERSALIGSTLLPSAVFWSSTVLKEPVVMASLGPLMLGLRWFADGRRRLLALAMLGSSALVMAMLKPYLLMALAVAAGVFYFRRRATTRAVHLKPVTLALALAMTYGGLVLGTRYFSKRSGDLSASTVAGQRRSGYQVEGGSNYTLENTSSLDETEDRSVTAELVLAPLALLTALFRPLLFEARNAVQLANALEATVLLVIALQLLRRPGWRWIVAEVKRSPTLTFCFIFTLALGLGTGLASSNLGTLSRYRAPMMPFFFCLLLVLRTRAARAPQPQSPGIVVPAPAQAPISRR